MTIIISMVKRLRQKKKFSSSNPSWAFKGRPSSNSLGFSLFELLVVLGLVGGIFGLLLGGSSLTSSSRVSRTLSEISLLLKGAFDEAVVTGRLVRFNFDLVSGTYWMDLSPLELRYRLKFQESETVQNVSYDDLTNEFDRQRRRMEKREEAYYSVRSFLLQNRDFFRPIDWQKGEDPALFGEKKLPDDLIFGQVQTSVLVTPVIRQLGQENQLVSTYFFPSAECIATAIYLETIKGEQQDRYTLLLDSGTGKVKIKEGYRELPFATK